MTEWTKRWGYEVRPTKTAGVLLTKDSSVPPYDGTRSRGRKRMVAKVVDVPSIRDARVRLEMLGEERQKPPTRRAALQRVRAITLRAQGGPKQNKSAKTRERWDTTLRRHLLPAFGRFAVDEITKPDIEAWKTRIAKKIAKGKLTQDGERMVVDPQGDRPLVGG